jgi:acyl carrier protein
VDTLHTIRSLAAAQFGGDADAIDVDVPVNQLGIDSLGLLEFLFELEDKFAVSIPPESLHGVPTLREVAAVVDGRLDVRAQQPT